MRESKKWIYCFAFLPHRCKVSGKWFWLRSHYICKTKISNPYMYNITEERYSKEEAIAQMASYFHILPKNI